MTGTRPFHCALSVKFICLETSVDRFLGREDHMTQEAALEFPQVLARKQYLGECSPSPSVAASNGTLGSIQRSEPRAHLSAPVWLTSLRRPGVLEVVPTENISRTGIRLVTREFWEPAEPVLVSSPPGFCVQGSVVYCRKLPSDDYVLGLSLDAPVEDWTEACGIRGA